MQLQMFRVPLGLNIKATVPNSSKYDYISRPVVIDKVISIHASTESVVDKSFAKLDRIPFIEFLTATDKLQIRWYFSPTDFENFDRAKAISENVYELLLSNSYDYNTALQEATAKFDKQA